jgi:hypothetical protein
MATSRAAAFVLTSFLVLGLSLAALVADDAPEIVTIEGRVAAASIDDHGNTTSVHLPKTSRGDVLVSNEGRGGELLDRVGARLSLRGSLSRLQENVGYDYVIRVTDYVVLEEPAPEGAER